MVDFDIRSPEAGTSGSAPSPRERWYVFVLGLASPGLAWAWRGYAARGVFWNLFLVVLWLGFAMYWLVEKFFPLEPFLWFCGGWLVLVVLSAWDASSARASGGAPSFFYLALMLVCSWLIPLGTVHAFVRENIAQMVEVRSAEMFPTLLPGDRLLIDRHIYRISRPRPGDIVYYHKGPSGEPGFGRVLAVEGEIVSVVQRSIYVSGMSVVQSPLDAVYGEQFEALTGADPAAVGARFEANGSSVYLIAEPEMGARDTSDSEDWFVRERELFVLNDNRSATLDSRHTGPIAMSDIIGMPVYVVGNRSEHTGAADEGRMAILQSPRTRAMLLEEQRRYLEMYEHR